VTLPAEQKQVYSFLQKSIERQDEQGNLLRAMVGQMLQIEANVKQVEEKVEQKYTEMSSLVQKVSDSVTLTDAECFQLQSKVHTLSIELAKEYFGNEETDRKTFSDQVGKFRRGVWKLVKTKFSVARYSHIRRIDFDEVAAYVGTIGMKDFVEV
jgi:chromosome segregation ATPase